LDSSSAVIIITIVFVNAGLLQLRQAMGIVLIANIRTTVSSQIIAMDVGKYAPTLLLVGFVLVLLSKSDRISQVGKVILYFGVLFLACSPYRKHSNLLLSAPPAHLAPLLKYVPHLAPLLKYVRGPGAPLEICPTFGAPLEICPWARHPS
jgi:hypothetical protein